MRRSIKLQHAQKETSLPLGIDSIWFSKIRLGLRDRCQPIHGSKDRFYIQIVHKSPTSVINASQLLFFQYNQMHSGRLSHRIYVTGYIYLHLHTITINNQLDVGKHTKH